MNLTISVDDKTVERVREIARAQGVSLQEMIRKFLEGVAGRQTASSAADELLGLMTSHAGQSGGKRFRRDDAYKGRV